MGRPEDYMHGFMHNYIWRVSRDVVLDDRVRYVKGERARVIMISRLGHVGLTKNFDLRVENGYDVCVHPWHLDLEQDTIDIHGIELLCKITEQFNCVQKKSIEAREDGDLDSFIWLTSLYVYMQHLIQCLNNGKSVDLNVELGAESGFVVYKNHVQHPGKFVIYSGQICVALGQVLVLPDQAEHKIVVADSLKDARQMIEQYGRTKFKRPEVHFDKKLVEVWL